MKSSFYYNFFSLCEEQVRESRRSVGFGGFGWRLAAPNVLTVHAPAASFDFILCSASVGLVDFFKPYDAAGPPQIL